MALYIELKEDRTVKIHMKEYVHEIITVFGEPMGKGGMLQLNIFFLP